MKPTPISECFNPERALSFCLFSSASFLVFRGFESRTNSPSLCSYSTHRAVVFPINPLQSLFNRTINIRLLPFPISFVGQITRSERVARRALRDPVGQGVHGIGEVHASLVAAVDRLPAKVLDAFEVRTTDSPAPERPAGGRGLDCSDSYKVLTSARNAAAFE